MAGPQPEPPEDMPADGQAAAVQAAFLKLRARFLAGLPRRLEEVASASTGESRELALHRLAGAAGSYGYTALGAAARVAEQALSADAAAFDAAMLQLEHVVRSHTDTVR